MKVSREKAAQNRAHVVDVASTQFREHGFDGIGIADLMKAAGLTHGGFYANFPSKEALAAEAVDAAKIKTTCRLTEVAKDSADPLAAIADFYLSPGHRDAKAEGCVLAALAGDAARKGGEVRETIGQAVDSYLKLLVPLMAGNNEAERRDAALGALSTMVGSLVLARAVASPELSSALLEAAARTVKSFGKRG